MPNDPRGSWSDFVRAWELRRFGAATKTNEKRSLAREPHNWRRRKMAKQFLAHKPVEFNGRQARAIGRGFAKYAAKSGLMVWACSILPTHVHLVIARHLRLSIEAIATQLKAAATRELLADGLHPFAGEPYKDGTLPTPWTRKKWDCFLDSHVGIVRSIDYVEGNPEKEGKPRQHWQCVTRYEGI